MWTPNHSMRVWLYRRPTDMRKSYNGLSTMVKRVMRDDPLSGALYVFINRRRTQMKCLYFEDDGYCVGPSAWNKVSSECAGMVRRRHVLS